MNLLLALGGLNDSIWKLVVSLLSADVKAAEEFLETLDEVIEKENYLPEQIFNMDKTSLF